MEAKNSAREQALKSSREAIRLSANAIRSVHREEFDDARQLMAQARQKIHATTEVLQDQLDIYYAGYVQDAQKEYAESELTYALVKNEPLPSHQALGVECSSYLNGLGEALGECRRHVLDLIRRGNIQRAEDLLQIMDEAFHVLVTFDYPEAVTAGLRRTTDMVRGVLERTRGDLTMIIRQQELEKCIESAASRWDYEHRAGQDS